MSLPVKKIYIDSQYKVPSSPSSSQFTIELPYTITMPTNAIFTIDEISIPHSWYTIEEDVNDKLYLVVSDPQSDTYVNIIAQVAPGNYNGITFRTAIQAALDYSTPTSIATYTVGYENTTGTITIHLNNVTLEFKVLSDYELTNKLAENWTQHAYTYGGQIDRSNIASVNDIF
jgi:hypothetical protein